MNCSRPGLPVHHQLSEFTQTHAHRVADAISNSMRWLSHPLSPPSPPALRFSQHQAIFQWVGSSHQVAKYWSFSFSISLSNDYSGLISFWIDWFDFFAVQRTLKSLLPHHSFEHQFLDIQPSLWSNLHICTWLLGKIIALTTDFCGQSEISAFEYAI